MNYFHLIDILPMAAVVIATMYFIVSVGYRKPNDKFNSQELNNIYQKQ